MDPRTDSRQRLNPFGQDTWRAGCGESRTSGSAGGLGKRAGNNPGTAPQADPPKEVAPSLSLFRLGLE